MGKWGVEPLGRLCSQEPGAIAIGPFGSRMKADCYTDHGTPVIRGTNISGGRSWKGDWVFVPNEFADKMPNCLATAGDLVFPHRGAIGEIGIVPNDSNRYIISTSLMKFRADKEVVNPLFLFYYFRSHKGREEILKFSSQVGTPGIGQPLSSLRQFKVPCPPLPEQITIAAILGSLDDKIDLNRRMNETLEAMARAIFKDWFVDFGPTRAKLEGRAPYLAQEIWDLFPDALDDEGKPVGWMVSTIGQCFNLTMGQSPPGDTYNDHEEGLPFFQGRTDFGFRYPENRKYCSSPIRIAEAEDTLVSVRAPVGDINLAGEKCCIGRGVAALRHKSGYRSFTCYSAWALQGDLKQYEHTGTVFGAINKNQFEAMKVFISSQDLIVAFEALASPLDDRLRANVMESSALAQTRDLLLPKLMSGEIRVKDAEKAVGTVL